LERIGGGGVSSSSLRHNTNIKIPVLKKKIVFQGDFRSSQDNLAFRQLKLDLLREEKTSLHVPQVAAHSMMSGFAFMINLRMADHFRSASEVWQEFCISTLLRSNHLR